MRSAVGWWTAIVVCSTMLACSPSADNGSSGREPAASISPSVSTPSTSTDAPTSRPSPLDGSPTSLPSPFEAVTATSGVAYGPDEEQVLDVYVPAASVPGPTGDVDRRPSIVLVHGGAWTGGARDAYLQEAATLATLGWVAVSVDYRLAPEDPHPAAADDVRAALEFVHDRAATLGIDPGRVVLAGDSAGGHLTGLVALADDRPPVAAWVAWSGVYDLAGLASRLEPSHDWLLDAGGAYLGCDQPTDDACRAAARAASPVTHASADDPPSLLLHSTDEIVPLSDAEAMQRALEAAGAQARLVTFDGSAHGRDLLQPSTDTVRAFLADVLELDL